MSPPADPPSVSIEKKRAWALEQHQLYGARLHEDDVVRRLLAELRVRVDASRETMIAAGLVDDCRRCEEEEGGSCCGRGMEDHYDGILLLVNLLVGATIENEPLDDRSCVFLGTRGCRLTARDHVCVNYLCMKVMEHLSPAVLAEMRRRQGLELHTVFQLTDRVTTLLDGFQADRGPDR